LATDALALRPRVLPVVHRTCTSSRQGLRLRLLGRLERERNRARQPLAVAYTAPVQTTQFALGVHPAADRKDLRRSAYRLDGIVTASVGNPLMAVIQRALKLQSDAPPLWLPRHDAEVVEQSSARPPDLVAEGSIRHAVSWQYLEDGDHGLDRSRRRSVLGSAAVATRGGYLFARQAGVLPSLDPGAARAGHRSGANDQRRHRRQVLAGRCLYGRGTFGRTRWLGLIEQRVDHPADRRSLEGRTACGRRWARQTSMAPSRCKRSLCLGVCGWCRLLVPRGSAWRLGC